MRGLERAMRDQTVGRGIVRRRILPILFLVIAIAWGPALAHEESRPQAIVDTDMAMDDVRALVILLNSEAVEPLLAVTSDGSASPRAGAANLKELLLLFNRGGLPVAMGRDLGKDPPAWRGLTEDLFRGETFEGAFGKA